MKSIKVKPDFFPNFEGKAIYADGTEVMHESFEKKENELSNELIMIFKNENNVQKILKMKGVDYNGRKFISSMPNPVFLLLNTAIDCLNVSNILIKNFENHSDKIGEKTYFFELNKGYTSKTYNHFLSNKISSITSLINCLEIFINQKIPKDFIFIKFYNDKEVKLNRKKIESSLSFKEKISNMLPKIYPTKNFSVIIDDISNIFDAYNLRKDIVHMKTGSETPFEQYYEVMGKISDSDIQPFIQSSINFMNFIQTNFIEFNLEK